MTAATPTLDNWTTLFLLAAGQGIFLSVLLLLRSRENYPAGRWLAALILSFSILLVFNVSFWTKYNWYFPPVNLIYPAFAFLTGPFLLFYLDEVSGQARFRRLRLLHFVPALLVFFLLLPGYLQPVAELQIQMEQAQMIRTPLHRLRLSWLSSYIFVVLHLLLYGVWVVLYGRRILQRSANPGSMEQNDRTFRVRIRLLVSLYGLYTLAFVSYYILVRMAFFQVEHDYIISWVMAASVYLIGYLEYRQTEGPEPLPKYSSSSLTPAAVASIAGRLESMMKDEYVYRNNELRLPHLAEGLGISPHHLSQVINERYDKTFNQFINDYRIREAMALLASQDHRQSYVIEIAYQVGFNNKTTFNQVFKSHTGMSPTEWRNRCVMQSTINSK